MERYEDPDRIYKYQYSSVNRSLVDRLLKYWWRFAIKLIPAKASANLVSIVGNLGSWFATALLCGLVVGPIDVAAKRSPWLFGLAALSLAFYHSLDAMDGIQARRTGSSGPLGEFVDHWFDSFNIFLVPLGLFMAFPVLPSAWLFIALLACIFADWTNLREVKMTNQLHFGPISSEEAMIALLLAYVSMWLVGYDFWALPLPGLGVPPIYIAMVITIGGSFATGMRSFLVGRMAWSREILAELLTLAPIAVWALIAEKTFGRGALLVGGLLMGLSGSRFIGDLLRSRLVGLAAPLWYPDLLVMDLLLLASILVPGLPAWVRVAAVGLFFAVLAYGLLGQFARTLSLVRERLGIGLFGPVRKQKLDTPPRRR
ncbi:MAG: CDP-alcohol phosphatidyltransferase family protein [Spirochaetaceae bacterium]|nr:CDP-alcohol phosphatidyltransferase family protein [Spirochaetaceae bacterium]